MRFLQNRVLQSTAAILGLVALTVVCKAGTMVRSEELRIQGQWVKEHLQLPNPQFPFSFQYDGHASEGLLPSWPKQVQTKKLDAARTQIIRSWADAKTGLQVRCVAVQYADFPVVEWTIYLKNLGSKKTPILENIQGLDTRFERNAQDEFVLHGNKGDWCVAESYQPFEITLRPETVKQFSPPAWSGKSCDGPEGWPYYNLQKPGGGVILAVGWPGQWATAFTRDSSNGLRIVAGQQRTHLYLKPGEEIRTPLIAMLFWQGTDTGRAQNLWRRWYMAHNIPRVHGSPQPPVTQIQVAGSVESLPSVEAYLEAGVKPDICWRDAGGSYTWYPNATGPYTGNDSWLNTGTWDPDPKRYPHGFKPFSDRVHALGMKFLLWSEPERVGDPNSWLGKNHPEWLLPGTSHGSLLNEGDPEALNWLINHVDGLIKSQGLDWYREDMNGEGPLPAWRKHDTDDRQGITENLYVQGHLAFWDELKRRNPGLCIDSCASGGRRNDLETMRRAVPLLRSDFQFPDMKGVIEGNQGHTYGLSSWLPWYGTGVFFIDTYAVRSFLMPGFGVVPPGNWEKSDSSRAAVTRAYEECRQIAPLMLGDYYPLTPYSLQPDQWIAWQFDRPEQGDGAVQAFRRDQCVRATMTFRLNGLDADAQYRITNFDVKAPTELSGKALMENGLTIAIKDKPGAAVITYKRIR